MSFILAKTPKGRALHRMHRWNGALGSSCTRLNGATLTVVSEHESIEAWADEIVAEHPGAARVSGCFGCFGNGGAWELRQARERARASVSGPSSDVATASGPGRGGSQPGDCPGGSTTRK